MKKLMGVILISAFMLGMSAVTMAQGRRINYRQRRERHRIHQGYRSGELTRREAARLKAEQRVIRRAETQARADGQITRRERHRINRLQNRASRDIHRQKHDRQDRNP